MNEHELSRHLANYASGVDGATDRDRLQAGMTRVDRIRRVRTVGAAGSLCALAAFGAFTLGASDSAGPQLDVRTDAPEVDGPAPEPDLGDPITDEAALADLFDDGDGSDLADEPTVPEDPGEPAHLQTPSTTTTIAPPTTTTTVAPTTTTVAPPPPSTTTTAPPPTTTTTATQSFTAEARYGSCEEPVPYDEYSGTAAPGTTVTITSPHSAPAQVVADGSGHWFLRVEFPDAPVLEEFTVTVSDGSDSVGLSFIRTA